MKRERERDEEIASLCGGLSPFVELVGVSHTPAGLGWDSAAMVMPSASCTVRRPLSSSSDLNQIPKYLTGSAEQDENISFELAASGFNTSFYLFALHDNVRSCRVLSLCQNVLLE